MLLKAITSCVYTRNNTILIIIYSFIMESYKTYWNICKCNAWSVSKIFFIILPILSRNSGYFVYGVLSTFYFTVIDHRLYKDIYLQTTKINPLKTFSS